MRTGNVPDMRITEWHPTPPDPRAALARVRHIVLIVFASAQFALPALSQDRSEPDPFAGVEEMIVTGSGTAALLAPTSTSAISFDTSALEAYGVEDLSDISAYVPNLEIRSANATNASFFVRGVGLQDFGANASSSVPIFQDGIPRNPSATQLVGLFDVSGLSVLKGPQGTGRFRNASAGAFIVETTKPEPEFSGFAKASIARIVSVDSRDANRYDFETAMNAPIYEDIVSIRLASRYSHENAFWENGCANRSPLGTRPIQQPGGFEPSVGFCGEVVHAFEMSQVDPFLERFLGEVDDFGFRASIRIQPPGGVMDWVIRGEISRLNRDSTTGQQLGTGGVGFGVGSADRYGYVDRDIQNRSDELYAIISAENPGLRRRQIRQLVAPILEKELHKRPLDEHPYRGDLDTPGKTYLDTLTISAKGTFDFEAADVKLNLGWVEDRKSEKRDIDLSPNSAFPSDGNDQAWELYADLAVTGEEIGDLPMDWDVGLYTLVEHVESATRQKIFLQTRMASWDQEIYSYGVYAQGRYEFLENFSLAAGARYNYERKDFQIESFLIDAPTTRSSRNQRSWDAFTGFGEIRFEFTEDIATYLKYTRGFKAGHFNPSRAERARIPNRGFADPESIDSFEWGLEFAAWSGRLNGSANFFFYNYQNYQVFRLTSSIEGVAREIQNAKRARNFGAEMELTLTPLEGFAPEFLEGLRINFRGGWLETNFVEFINSEERAFPGGSFGVNIDYSGNPLISAPNLQIATTFIWPLDLGRLGVLTPQYDFTWTDDTPFDPNNGKGEIPVDQISALPPYMIGNRAYLLHNVRLQWQPADDPSFKVAGWCRNVTDERYKTFAVDISTFSNQILVFVADPRVCGADFTFNW